MVALVAAFSVIASLAFGASAAFAVTPTITLDEPSAEYTSAQLSATIDVHGEAGNRYAFQYSTDGGATWTWDNNTDGNLEALLQKGPLPALSGPQPVSGEFVALKPGTEYKARLLVTGLSTGGAFVISPNQPTFTTHAATPPTATIDPVTTFTGITAHFSGTIDVNAPDEPLSPAAEAAYRVKWHFECTPECHGLDGGVVNVGESGVISDDANRLEANTFHQVKLVAESGAGNVSGGPVSFMTPLIPVGVEPQIGASDGEGGYILEGLVTPNNSKVTDCHFEYGPTTAYVYEAPCSPNPTGRDEVQEIHIEPVSAGQFKLSIRGQVTDDLPANATAAQVETALQALSPVGAGGVSVTSSSDPFAGTTYVATFGGARSSSNIGEIQFEQGTIPLEDGGEPRGGYVVVAAEGGNSLPVVVEAHVTGLTPNVTYHFQVVATNSTGTTSSGDRTFIPTLSSRKEDCPNAGLRSENRSLTLPECRAYEMVSPGTKNGYAAGAVDYSDDGGVVYETLAGNIANSGSGGVQSRYVTLRTDAGWQTIPNLNGAAGSPYSGPDALFGGTAAGTAFSSDLRSSIWQAGRKGESGNVINVYLRRPDGTFVEVGPGADRELAPMNPSNTSTFDNGLPGGNYGPIDMVGASTDLSHLVVNGSVAPTAPMYGPGVYEFVGTGNDQPRRVDVDDSGDPISTCDGGGIRRAGAAGNAVSGDGSTIVFTVTGACGAGNPASHEIWARVDGTSSYEASESHCTRTAGGPDGACNAPAPAVFEGAATNGSRIYFSTTQQLVNADTDATNDLYAYDLPSGSNPTSSLVEVSGAAEEAKVQGVLRVSDDGSTVYFVSPAILAANEDALEEPASPGERNLYVWQRDASHPAGQTTFVGRLDGVGDDCRLWGTGGQACKKKAQTTSDGRYLVLPTLSRLVSTDTDNAIDLYRYDADSGETIRVSTNIYGVGGNSDGFDVSAEGCTSGFFNTFSVCSHSHSAVSDDGEAIVFSTSEALSPKDGNNASDVYLWKAGQVSLISTGAVGGDVGGKYANIDASGKNIYFTTPQPLTPTDSDAVDDVYDARVEGGFPDFRDDSCVGEACQPKSAGPAAVPGPATDRANGTGNVKPGSVTIRFLSSADRAKLGSGAKVGLRLNVSAPGKVSLKGTAKIGGKQKQVIRATFTAKKAGEVKVPITLSKAAQAQLRKDGSLTVQLTVQLGEAPAQTSKLVLKSPRAKSGHSKRRGG